MSTYDRLTAIPDADERVLAATDALADLLAVLKEDDWSSVLYDGLRHAHAERHNLPVLPSLPVDWLDYEGAQIHAAGRLPRVHYSTIINNRDLNADAIHVCRGAAAFGIAIADGAGDIRDAAQAALIAAQVGATMAATSGSAGYGMASARNVVDDRNATAPYGHEGVTTLTVLSIAPGNIQLAWAGDSPAWGITADGEVVGLTTPSCHPNLTPCNASVWHPELSPHLSQEDLSRFCRIILASDGLTAHLPLAERHDHVTAMIPTLKTIADPDQPSDEVLRRLLRMAYLGGGGDNTTIAVVDLVPVETTADSS